MHIMKRTYLTEAQHHCMQTWLSPTSYSCEVLPLCSFKSFQKAGGRQQYCLSKITQLTFSKLFFQAVDSLVQHYTAPYQLKLQLLRTNAVQLTSTKYLSVLVLAQKTQPQISNSYWNSLMDLIRSHSCCIMYYLYRSHLYSTFLKPRRCSETQSQKHLLQQRQSFMEDILACFSTAGEMQEVCKGCVHKAQRQGSKIIYTKKKKKTDTVLLSICSLAYEVFI